VAQKFSLYPDLTVLENLRFFGSAYQVSGSQLAERIETLLDQLDLRAKRNEYAAVSPEACGNCSRLACAQVHQPACSSSMSRPPVSTRCIGSRSGISSTS
jgi:ABC-2 type transport system ATP-binding protein